MYVWICRMYIAHLEQRSLAMEAHNAPLVRIGTEGGGAA